MSNNLSSSQLDLVINEDGPFAPGHVKPRNYDSKIHQSNSKHSAMFLETEKNGGALRRKGNGTEQNTNKLDIRKSDPDESLTETSTL